MAYKGKILINPVTGQNIKFIQTANDTNGLLLEMETTYKVNSQQPISHYHPHQFEDFTVLEGEMHVKLDGELRVLKAGDTLHIPANCVHAMWNPGATKAVVNWQVSPAMDTEHMLETTWGLAADGKVNKKGMPGILQVALTLRRFSETFRSVKPSYNTQRLVFAMLTPVAYLLGYRPTYKKYIDNQS